MEILTLDTTDLLLLTAVGGTLLMQIVYYLALYNCINRNCRKMSPALPVQSEGLPPLSVIICSHNQADDLQANLTFILEQDYPQFEVIVINEDNTAESNDYLKLQEGRYPHLYHSFVPESTRGISNRKLAATLGVKASKYDWLVFTRPECRPQSDQWLKMLARNFTPQTQVVLGYSNYASVRKAYLRHAILDRLFLSMRYLGFALAGHPYMGIGCNMAYRKELFYSHKGFSTHLNLQQGDDDLFINQVATRRNTKVETSRDSVVRIRPMEHYKEWWEEKVSHATTARYYRGMQRYLIGWETTTRLAFYSAWTVTCIFCSVQQHWLAAGLSVVAFLLRFLLQAVIVNKTARNLAEQRRFYLYLPVFDLLQPLQSLRCKLSLR